MKKSIFLFFAAILCAMNASAYKLYLYTGKVGWQDGNAKFQVWTNKNVDATKIGNNWYSFDVGTYTGTAYIKRNNPSGGTWNEFSASISSTNNFARVTDWNTGAISSLHVTGDNWNGIGDWENNNDAGKMTIDGNTFTKTFENVSAAAHKFKLTFKGTWDNAIGHGNHVSCVNGTVNGDDGNIVFTPTVAGNVTITYNMADGKITITCATPKYTISTSANPAEGGTVTEGGTYDAGTSVKLTATPNTGYEFENWTEGGNVVSNTATLEFNISSDRTLVANFKVPVPDAVKYQVNVSANDNTMGTVTGAGEYEEGTTALLTATPNSGYQFKNWTVAGTEVSTTNPYTFTVNEDVTVTANFEELPKETIYFVNNKAWDTVNAYAWNKPSDVNNGWPGAAATKTEEKVAGFDVYSFTAIAGQYTNVIFNGGGSQTADLVWTDGKYYWMGAETDFAGATKEEVETELAAPVEYESVYFVNAQNWTAVNIYTWTPEIGTWPGKAMTKEEENQIAGYDVYSYTVEKGTTFGGFNFNEGDQKRQTGDLTWNAGKYYVIDNWYTKAEAEAKLATLVKYDYYIAGTKAMTGHEWNAAGLGMEGDAEKGMYSHDFTLAAGSHEFKVTNGTWDSSWGFSNVARKYKEVSEGKNEKGEPNGNVKITLDKETAVTVVFYSKDKTIEFNGLTLIHTVKVTAENGTVAGDGEYTHGEQATLTATAAAGYEFVNWTVAGEEVSTEATYSFTVTADVEVVANFKEAEPVYQVIEDEITNFVFDMEAWPMVCLGGPSANYQIDVFLVLTEDADGTLSYEDCSVSIMGTDATFIEGTLSNLDPYAPSADAVLRVQWNEEFYELHLAMSAAAAEPIVVVVENATLDDQVESTGFFYMAGECTIDGVTYPVKAEIPGFDKTKAEAEYENVMVEVGTWGGEYLGNATGTATISVVDNVVTLSGVIENPMTHVAFDVTISGTLPVEEPDGPTTALDNLSTTVAPVKGIENGQLIIVKDGVQYNAQGAILK